MWPALGRVTRIVYLGSDLSLKVANRNPNPRLLKRGYEEACLGIAFQHTNIALGKE